MVNEAFRGVHILKRREKTLSQISYSWLSSSSNLMVSINGIYVLHPKKGSIAETSVTLLKTVDFAIFNGGKTFTKIAVQINTLPDHIWTPNLAR